MEFTMNSKPLSNPVPESPALLSAEKWRITRSVLLVLLCSVGAATLSVHWLTPIV